MDRMENSMAQMQESQANFFRTMTARDTNFVEREQARRNNPDNEISK